MGELKAYLTQLQRVRENRALMTAISEHDAASDRLQSLLQSASYDRAEVIRLSNDVEELSQMIRSNPLYQAYVSAKNAWEASNPNRSACGCGCSGNCAGCQCTCNNRKETV